MKVLRERQRCEAYFHIAAQSRKVGDRQAMLTNLDRAAALDAAKLEVERYLARYEGGP